MNKQEAEMTARKRIAQGVPTLWMICREDSNSYATSPNPKVLYTDEAKARRDAEDLCKQSNKRFYLLKVVAVVQTTVPPVAWDEA